MKAELNIWACEKDDSIKLLLLLLTKELGNDNFDISENINLDSRSVRIHSKDDHLVSVYIYTYGQLKDKYGIHLEFPFHDEADISSSMDIYEGVSFDRLLDLVRSHLDLTF